MGLNASSDKWCCRSDRIVLGLPWAKNIVENTIIWAPMLEELQCRAIIILESCRDLNITISLKKLELGKEITFAGHIVSSSGIRPDDSKYKAIAVSQLSSFLGLANQLASLIPDLAHITANLRPLIKKGTGSSSHNTYQMALCLICSFISQFLFSSKLPSQT